MQNLTRCRIPLIFAICIVAEAGTLVWDYGVWGNEWGHFQLDMDGDGEPNTSDAFPGNSAEWLDTDADNIGNNADPDDDGDNTPDVIDIDPLNQAVNEENMPLDAPYKGARIIETSTSN